LILKFSSRYVGLFLRFATQWLPTDDATGHRSPEAQPIPAGGSPLAGGGGPTLVTHPAVYIERALVNPDGDEPGKEVVVIGNTTVASVDLTGWSIVDKNNKADVLSGVLLPAGESRRVVLSGNGAQLSNKGGTIILKNPAGDQVHAVAKRCGRASSGRRRVVVSPNRLHEAQQARFRPLAVGENGGASHQHIGASVHRQRGRLEVDAAIDLELTMSVALLQQVPCPLNFRQHAVDEALPTEARVDGHDQQQVDVGEDVFDRRGGRRGVEAHSGLFLVLFDQLHGPMQMRRGFLMDDDDVGTRLNERLDVALRLLDHQVHL
jgi:hypothetical protein